MWDPQAYRDTDYGLPGGERFEPDDLDDDERQVLDRPHVMTVLGPIEPDQLGICQPHEHVLRDGSASSAAADGEQRLDRLDFAAAELEIFFTVGGRSMVDLTTREQGRNLGGLLALAQRVPVHLIASTGLWAEPDGTAGPDRAVDDLIAEISQGVGPSRVKPGVLTVAADSDMTDESADQIARILSTTGIPLFIRDAVAVQLARIRSLLWRLAGTNAQVMVGGVTPEIGAESLTDLARSGAHLCFDAIGRRGPNHDGEAARTITSLAEAGLAHRILVSQGLGRTSEFVSYGGQPGWGHLLERFTLTLMEAGASALLVRQVLVDNPAEALAISPPSRGK